MLTFYYHPLSPIARRVWIALIENGIDYEPVIVQLSGDQYKPGYLALNPFHHVPVLVDDGFSIIESIAILDYLELKYPSPSLLPKSPEAIARMRMAQMVSANEIITKVVSLVTKESNPTDFDQAIQHVNTALGFLANQLDQSPYFGGEALTLGDVVVAPTIGLMSRLGVSLEEFPHVQGWFERVTERESWQVTEPSDRDFKTWKRFISLTIRRKQKQKEKAKLAAH
ncbi:MAG: glutathione S-transferase family protein [Leptolyngbyaceae cyanobacterium]